MKEPETVVVQREKSEDNPTGQVLINKDDLADGDVVVTDAGEEVFKTEPLVNATIVEATAPADAPAPETPPAPEEAPAADGVVKAPWSK